MMLANAIQQRNQAVIENVEEIAKRFVVVRRALQDELRARRVERAETAGETEKVDRHLSRCFRPLTRGNVSSAFNLGDVARRKIEFYFGAEVNDLLRRIRSLSGRHEAFTLLRVNDLEQANGLEKVEAMSFGEEPVFDRRLLSPTVIVYSRTVSPAIGSHCFQIPSRCLLLITSCVNELIAAYEARKRLSTAPKRKPPLPS